MLKRIMFVTDEAIEESLISSIREHGFEVAIEQPDSAYQQAFLTPPDLLVLDILNADRAIDFLKSVRSSAALNQTSVLVLTAWGTGQATLALSHGADGFESKPVDATRLLNAVERLMRPQLVMAATASSKETRK